MVEYIFSWLTNRYFLWILFIVNLFGTIYGYYWYRFQLADTEPIFLIFVPDSPTASLFFTIVIFGYLINKQWPLIEALAIITLFKYGIWAVVMNFLTWGVTGQMSAVAWMLVISHAAMALQGILYSSFFRIKYWHILVAALWTFHNDVIDYVYMQYPVYSRLSEKIEHIGYFTFWLSVASILVAWYFCIHRKDWQRTLHMKGFSA
ncbi:DUF1405 domain-containing protein [Jeotgalibacillus salarius]|uniref:DUF1405 domain-containing protein n=1 Tax=Jeotgalibacillus salarius TaxID=546023 RepID=A0A4Y8LM73_9BACL|nr:DUF1405 domain-containing protein [Jeotgalibacillus salarius]TFE03073.1 DUF1405 domain-containing protein [Jeotgalibacillus salarius]